MQPLLQWRGNKYYILWVCVCSIRYPAWNAHAPNCHLWSVELHHVFPHCLTNVTISLKQFLNISFVSIFPAIFVWNIPHFKKKSARYCTKCRTSSCKVAIFFQILMKVNFFSTDCRKIRIHQISWKSVQWEPSCSMRAGGQTYTHDEANSPFPQFCECAWVVEYFSYSISKYQVTCRAFV